MCARIKETNSIVEEKKEIINIQRLKKTTEKTKGIENVIAVLDFHVAALRIKQI